MRKSTTIMLIIVLILQMCTGFLVNSNGSDRTGIEVSTEPLEEYELDASDSRSDDGLVAQWHFDEGSGNQVRDSSGNGNNGTLNIGGDNVNSKWVDGKRGTALNLDGVNDYVNVGNSPNLRVNNLTAEAWIKWKSFDTDTPGIMGQCGSVGNYGWVLWLNSETHKIRTWISTDGTTTTEIGSTSPALELGRWYHVAMTYDGDTIRLFIDGVLEDSSTSLGGNIYASTTDLEIGHTLTSEHFSGIIDEVSIHDRALSQMEIATRFSRLRFVEQDEFGGSWFDDFEDESGVEWKYNISILGAKVNLKETSTWSQQLSGEKPPARNYHTMIYDSIMKKVLLFGGCNGSSYLNDTWTYDIEANTWTERFPEKKPSAVMGHTMIYDSTNEKTVMYGGWGGSGTWVYDSLVNLWSDMSPANQPTGFIASAMTYDSDSKKVIHFGGSNGGTVTGATSVYDTAENTWTVKSPGKSPPGRYRHAMAYDCVNNKVVLFGGGWGKGNDTWLYDIATNTWDQKFPNQSPSARYGHAMTYDSQNNKIVLFGGAGGGEESWIYDVSSNNWTQVITDLKPSSRQQHTLVYDSHNNKVILFGGTTGNYTNETWVLELCKRVFLGTITSKSIKAPMNHIWDLLSISKTEPVNTFINVSIIDSATNQTIVGFDNLTNRTIDITPLNDLNIPSIRLKAYFSGNGSATPSLESWGVEWMAENAWRDSFVGNSKIAGPSIADEHTMGLWHFDRTNNDVLVDSSLQSNHGTIHNADWCEGRNGAGLEFDGSIDYVRIPHSNSLKFHHSPFTVELWIKINDDAPDGWGVWPLGKEVSSTGYGLYISSTGIKNEPHFFTGGTGLPSKVSVEVGKWYHIAGAFNGTHRMIYVNGHLTNMEVSDVTGSNKDLFIGAWGDSTRFFNGTIDEVRISNITRTPEEIMQSYQAGIAVRHGQVQLADNEIVPDQSTCGLWHFNEGEGNVLYDSSGNGNDGVINGANWTDGVMGGALEFDGVDDYMEVPDSSDWSVRNGDFTIGLWMKRSRVSPTAEVEVLIGQGSTVDDAAFSVIVDTDGTLQGTLYDIGSIPYYATGPKISDMEWHYIVFLRSSTTLKVYLDGEVGTSTGDVTGITRRDSGKKLLLGTWNTAEGYFMGRIDEVHIYNHTLTPSEIYNHSRLYPQNATLRSESVNLPSNHTWSNFRFHRTQL